MNVKQTTTTNLNIRIDNDVKNHKALAKSIKQINEGKIIKHNLIEV